jgi:hypothetical protein
MRPSSMTSFDIRIEPGPAPRLAAIAVIVHVAAAASPWLLGVPRAGAVALSLVALAALASTLSSLPGRHHALRALVVEGGLARARLAGATGFVPARLGAGSRAWGGLAFIDIRTGNRRCFWLLPRASLPPGRHRRLRARIRLSC